MIDVKVPARVDKQSIGKKIMPEKTMVLSSNPKWEGERAGSPVRSSFILGRRAFVSFTFEWLLELWPKLFWCLNTGSLLWVYEALIEIIQCNRSSLFNRSEVI